MSRRRIAIIAAATVGAGVIAGGGVAYALNTDREANLTGPAADRAIGAALAHVGGGSATVVEREGEGGGSYEVEVVTRAGQPLEVRLDARFRVIGVEGDTDDHNASEDQAGFDDD